MLPSILSIPVMLILSVLQSAAVSRLNVLSGNADIILLAIVSWGVASKNSSVFIWAISGGLFISIITTMPFFAVLIAYVAIAGITWLIIEKLWQSPILAVLFAMAAGTVVKFVIDMIGLQFLGVNFGLSVGITNVLLPNLILNLFFLFPVYLLISDLSKWIYPDEEYES